MRIIEGDIFADFEKSPAVRLAALDGMKQACLIGSFSKTIFASMDIVPCTIPRAGLYLWCRLPGGMNSTDVVRSALTHQVVLATGNAFSLARDFSDYLRFNVAQTHHESMYAALELSMNQTRQDHLG